VQRPRVKPGDRVGGRFELLAEIGEGGMGRVYEALDLRFERAAAVKMVHRRLAANPEYRARFEREAAGAERANHPHVLPVWDHGRHGDFLYLATPLCDTDLAELVYEERGRLDPPHALRILAQIAWALDWAHARGVVHRDVKPENVLLITGPTGEHAYLADFGLAKATNDETLTRVGHAAGLSPAYAAPEQWLGLETGAAADQYALAATLYGCLAGRPPFNEHHGDDLRDAHLTSPPPRLDSRLVPHADALSDVIARGLAKRPEARYASCGEFIAAATAAIAEAAPGGRYVPEADGAYAASSGAITEIEPGPADPEAMRIAMANASTIAPAPSTASEPVAPEPSLEATELDSRVLAPPSDTTELDSQPPQPAAEATELDAEATELDAEATELEAASATHRRRLLPAAAMAGAALFAIVVGFGTGRATRAGEPAPAPAASTIHSGVAGLTVPAAWESAAPPPLSGLALRKPVAYQPPGADPGTLVVGTTGAAVGPALLPAAFAARLADAPTVNDRVTLGRVAAYRQRNAAVRGLPRPATIYTAQTPDAVAVILCLGGSVRFRAQCDSAATTLGLPDGRPLGPDAELATRIDAIVGKLNAARTSGRRRLRAAKSAGAQAVAARALADDFATAASGIAKLDTLPADHAAVVGLGVALGKAADVYRTLGRAAGKRQEAAYRRASAKVSRSDEAVKAAMRRFDAVGYRVVPRGGSHV
jgi:hypothetical protein